MVKFIRVILLLLLVVIIHKVGGHDFICKQVISIESENVCFLRHQEQITASDCPFLPIAELTSSINSQILVSRLQRLSLIAYLASLRNALRCCAEHAGSLYLHQGKIYATTTSYHCEPSSDYYVFTLKHIII